MKVISSQHYINYNIVDSKLEEQWMDGDWYYVLDSDPEARRLVW